MNGKDGAAKQMSAETAIGQLSETAVKRMAIGGHGRDEHHRGADPDADGACGRPAEHAREAEHPAQAEHDVEDEPGQEFA